MLLTLCYDSFVAPQLGHQRQAGGRSSTEASMSAQDAEEGELECSDAVALMLVRVLCVKNNNDFRSLSIDIQDIQLTARRA